MTPSSPYRAFAFVVAGLLASGCGGEALVAELRYAPVPPAPEEAFRAEVPDSSPVPLAIELPWRQTTLANGMHVVLLERHELPIVSVHLVLARGRADAGAPLDTFSVFVNLLGVGSAQRTARELSAAWTRFGTSPSASAGPDGCEFSARISAPDFGEAVALIAEVARHPRITPEAFVETRKKWRDNFESNGAIQSSFGRVAAALLFGQGDPYGFKKPDVAHTESMGLGDITALFAQLIEPSHATLVVVGDVTPASVDAVAAGSFGNWASTMPPLELSPPPPPREAGPHTAIVRRNDREQTVVAVLARLGPLLPEELATVEVFGRAIGGNSSTLHRAVRDDLGAAYSFGSWITTTRSTTTVGLGGPIDPSKAAATLRATVTAIRGARAGTLDDGTVERARSSLLADFRTRASTNEGLASMAVGAVAQGHPLDGIASYPARISAVTTAAVKTAANHYFADEALRVIVLGNTKDMGDIMTFAPVVWWNGFAESQ